MTPVLRGGRLCHEDFNYIDPVQIVLVLGFQTYFEDEDEDDEEEGLGAWLPAISDL